MTKKRQRDIVHRWEGNPVISLDDLPFTSTNMYSAAALKLDGHYLLLVTMETLNGETAIYSAKSDDGFHFVVDSAPFLAPSKEEPWNIYEEVGVREPRITALDGKYYITYLGVGHHGILLCLAVTEDFQSVEKLGVVSEPETKAGALFPKKFNGRYARLERPRVGGRIWYSLSTDLLTWGESEVVLSPRPGFWDAHVLGCGVTPIEIDEGWLLIYYGIKNTSAGPITRLGAAILDKNCPREVIARSDIPILSPRESYERIGDHNNFVLSTGAILEDNGEIKIYYGAANNCLCVGATQLSEIINTCNESKREY